MGESKKAREDRLVGLAEVAAILGKSRQRANWWTQRAGFPAPRHVLERGRLWSRLEVVVWAKRNEHRLTRHERRRPPAETPA